MNNDHAERMRSVLLTMEKAMSEIAEVTQTMPVIPDDPQASHLHHVQAIAQEDAEGLIKGDPKYGYSWKARGGVGAFMMLARKFDRLNYSLSPNNEANSLANLGKWLGKDVSPWDVFGALAADTRSEGVIDDIRDLRRYLMLIEAEARARGYNHDQSRDNRDNSEG
jgi:hypothetical protein